MLEFAPIQASVVRCFADPPALDQLPAIPDAIPLRIAGDELMLLTAASKGAGALARATAHLASADPQGVALEQTSGWKLWALRGSDAAEAMARLCANRLPDERPGFLQSAVGDVPAKVLVTSKAIYVMVPAPYGHHLHERITEACADLAPAERPAEPLTL